MFNVSPTPVREAFLRLAAEKYLVINARREVLVESKSMEDVQELYEVVRALDKLAVKKALKSLNNEGIKELKIMTGKLGEYYKKKDIQKYLQLNLKIHDRIWKNCENKFLYETLTQLMEKISIYRRGKEFHAFSEPSSLDKSYKDHLDILKGVESKNIKELEKLINTHWGEEFFLHKSDAREEK